MFLFCSAILPVSLFSATVWREGESADVKRTTRHGWYDSVKKEVLSESRWISHYDNSGPGEAGFTIQIPETAAYKFWVRCNTVAGPKLSYKFDTASWKLIDLKKNVRETINIASDNKPDMRFISWVKVGTLSLSKGRHTLSFRMHSRIANHGAIDCFCLTTEPFAPAGTTKPQAAGGPAAPDEWFPVSFDDDPFFDESVIDLSSLIDKPAGKFGFLKTPGDTLGFERSRKPVTFWAVGANVNKSYSEAEMIQAARFYTKHGINLVRQHTVINAVGLLDRNGRFDRERMNHYDRWFSILKRHGIYTCWSVLYPHHGPFLREQDGLDAELFALLDSLDKNRNGKTGSIVSNDYINMDRGIQDIGLRYFTALLQHRNPYTGLRYRDDPALIVVEMQNESNLFFHTLNDLASKPPGRHIPADRLRSGFFDFVKNKYGSREKTARAWNRKWHKHDNWDKGQLSLMAAYHWGADGPQYEYKGEERRCGDYIAFLAQLQKSYYDRRYKELRALGFKGRIVTTAWKGVGASSLANLYCDATGDIIDRHNYFGGGAGGHRIVEGDVNTETHLDRPGRGLLNLGLFQVSDKPFVVSEWNMMPPNPWKAEAAPLYAFYGLGLQGWDISYHFCAGSTRFGNGWPGLSKYCSHTPHYMGQFPALAFAVYHNHIKEGDIVARRCATEEMMFSGKDALKQSIGEGGHDTKVLGSETFTPPEYLAIGRVTLQFGKGASYQRSVSRYWDRNHKVITSTTGELVWDYGKKVVQVKSPKTQAVIGFAQGMSFDLPGVQITDIKTPFLSLIFTPLDNKPLAVSRKILITAMAREKQTGSRFSGDWSKLLAIGRPPLLMEPVQAEITFKGRRPATVRALDVYGVPTGDPLKPGSNGSFTIDGTYRTYYYFVTRNL